MKVVTWQQHEFNSFIISLFGTPANEHVLALPINALKASVFIRCHLFEKLLRFRFKFVKLGVVFFSAFMKRYKFLELDVILLTIKAYHPFDIP